jgi:hypothetical protein
MLGREGHSDLHESSHEAIYGLDSIRCWARRA